MEKPYTCVTYINPMDNETKSGKMYVMKNSEFHSMKDILIGNMKTMKLLYENVTGLSSEGMSITELDGFFSSLPAYGD